MKAAWTLDRRMRCFLPKTRPFQAIAVDRSGPTSLRVRPTLPVSAWHRIAILKAVACRRFSSEHWVPPLQSRAREVRMQGFQTVAAPHQGIIECSGALALRAKQVQQIA